MAPELALGGLQRWMQAVVVHPGSLEAALARPEAASLVPKERLGEVVLPSAALSPAERVGVYHGMYRLRMAEALESDYPALAHFLGEERWLALVEGYCAAHPSRSHTLNVLGRHLAAWLAEAPSLRHRGFCRDLARLEWAVTEAFDAEEAPRLAEADLAAVPSDGWDAVRLVPAPALRLLDLAWNANEFLDSTKEEGHDHPRPRRRAARVAVFRRDYAVYRRELSLPAFRLLSDLASGRSVGEALNAALARRAAPGLAELERWFGQWAADGLFARVDLARSSGRRPRAVHAPRG